MEKIIIVVLLGVIAILLYSREKVKNNQALNKTEYDPLPGVPDIMGRPKLGGLPGLPTQAIKTEINSSEPAVHNFDTVNKQETKVAIPQEEPDEEHIPDWDDEEEEMKGYVSYAAYSIDDGLATGVTYDELAAMGKMLERHALEPSEEKTAADIVSKIDGTELLGLLESKVGEASIKIAMLLDRELTS